MQKAKTIKGVLPNLSNAQWLSGIYNIVTIAPAIEITDDTMYFSINGLRISASLSMYLHHSFNLCEL